MKRILFVNPAFDEYSTGLPQTMRRSASAKWSPIQVGILPLGLATVAALTPDSIAVDFWDEGVQGQITAADLAHRNYDLIGVTGYVNHAGRMIELGQMFRQMHVLTVAGGPGVSSEPERFREHFDILFIGEAEYTWPRFIADRAAGIARPEYRQVDKVNMADSPPPKWEGVNVDAYLIGAVQTTRGCPFDCEFCDVIYLFGRTARHKPIERVVEEVSTLYRRGMTRILFCDDNFIGNWRYAKDLLRALRTFNRTLRQPITFLTNVTLNVARDQEMLELFADANFGGVFIGIESPNVDSLKETNKPQNYTVDMLDAVRTIHGYGIVIQSGLIVGFDHDDTTVFDQHFAFIQESGVPVPMINILKAPTGTKLWTRLLKKGRVFQSESLRSTSSVEGFTNVIPERMSLVELLSGYISLVERARDWSHFERRIHTLLSQFRRRPDVPLRFELRKLLLLLVMLLQMNSAGRRTALRLLLYTLRRAPFMLERVMGAVAYQYQEALRVPHLQRSIAEQIRQLETGGMSLQREQKKFDVPEGFRRFYPVIFPELYARVREGLDDQSRAEVALVEVTYDFLARWGSSFREFEEHHRTFLHELCDRTIAVENGGPPGRRQTSRQDAGAPPSDEVRIKRLADDVLRCVEQDLRMLGAHA
ncbi:MAG TPA: radical SAM protein [Thermoanaerobaculia bacterium]|nr:radical SAM protein [Thermoanaerobaculia bacterium]